MIFIERLEMFFVVLPSGISGTIHVDEVSLIFSQPASRLFSSDTIFQVVNGLTLLSRMMMEVYVPFSMAFAIVIRKR